MQYSLRTIVIAILATSLLLSACDSAPAAPPAARLWFVDNTSVLLGQLAPVQAIAPAPTDTSQIVDELPTADCRLPTADCRLPSTRWLALERTLVAREWLAPTRAARCYALLAGGMSDALLVAASARQQGMEVSDDAALAAAARQIIGYNHPALAEIAQQHADHARWVGVWSGHATAAGVAAGEHIGTAVADRVIAWAQRDRAEQFSAFAVPAQRPGIWQPTPPHLWSALDPGWGNVRPIVIPSGAQMDAAPPPDWASAAFQASRADFAERQRQLTPADHALAARWAGGMGSPTPAGLWLEIADELVIRDQLTSSQATEVYATLAVAMHDAFIAGWHSKYRYLVVRPVTWMRERDPGWLSPLETPPFPAYPSGHATVSGAASTVLAAYFPQDAARLRAMARDAAYSRIVGGIHWSLDSRAGLDQGQQIGRWVLTHPANTAIKLWEE